MSWERFWLDHLPAELVDDPDRPRRWRLEMDEAPACWPFDQLHRSLVDILTRVPAPSRARFEAWGIDWAAEFSELSGEFTFSVPHGSALELLRRGALIYMQDLECASQDLAQLAEGVARALGLPEGSCRVEALAAIAGGGAPPHWDPDYAINVQLRGHKRWHFAPNHQVEAPSLGASIGDTSAELKRELGGVKLPEMDQLREQATDAFEVGPGDVIWVPRGWWHWTEVTEQTDSLALVVGISPPTLAQILSARLKRLLSREPAWRAMAFGMCGAGDQRVRWRGALEHAAGGAQLGSLALDDVLHGVPEQARALGRLERVVPRERLTLRREMDGSGRLVFEREDGESVAIPMPPPLVAAAAVAVDFEGAFDCGQLMEALVTEHPGSSLTADAAGWMLWALIQAQILAPAEDR